MHHFPSMPAHASEGRGLVDFSSSGAGFGSLRCFGRPTVGPFFPMRVGSPSGKSPKGSDWVFCEMVTRTKLLTSFYFCSTEKTATNERKPDLLRIVSQTQLREKGSM